MERRIYFPVECFWHGIQLDSIYVDGVALETLLLDLTELVLELQEWHRDWHWVWGRKYL